MKVKNLELQYYRNYSSLRVDFSDGLNVFVGSNAQGKTNLLEAIYMCSIGRSLRVNKEKQTIKWNEENAKISLNVDKKYGKSKIEIILSKSAKKTVRINKIPIKKMGELMGELNAIFFSPDELKLVKESPEDRRRFMDISISQMSKEYFYLLGKYEKILASRNKLLKFEAGKETIKNTLDIWNEQLANVGSKIIFQRIEFLKNLSPYAVLSHEYLTEKKEVLKLDYVGLKGETQEEIKKKFLSELEKNIEKDLKLCYTTVGPHRDDIKVSINDIDVKTFGSQGQQRTVALSLKLAEIEIIEKQTGEKPILLLDDVLSELDTKRKKRLINFCKKTQTFLTCTEFDYEADKVFVIEDGTLKNK